MSNNMLAIILLVIGVGIGFFIGRIARYWEIRRIRKDAVKRSKSSILWEVYEKVLPCLPDFPYAPRDMVFVWKGVDYIVFDGLHQKNLQKIIFLEIKSGTGTLNANERMIRNTVQKKHISYECLHVDAPKRSQKS